MGNWAVVCMTPQKRGYLTDPNCCINWKMGSMSKSPVKMMKRAHEVAKRVLPDYSHKFSPKKFTQAQLFACLVLKMFLRTDYRGVSEILRDAPSFCDAIGLKDIPHFTTLQKSERRLLQYAQLRKMIEETIFFGAGSKKNH